MRSAADQEFQLTGLVEFLSNYLSAVRRPVRPGSVHRLLRRPQEGWTGGGASSWEDPLSTPTAPKCRGRSFQYAVCFISSHLRRPYANRL